MDITLHIERKKDNTKKVKTVMWVVYRSKKKGYEHIVAVNELPKNSSLFDEARMLSEEMVELRKNELLAAKKK